VTRGGSHAVSAAPPEIIVREASCKKEKPGTISRLRALREFQFRECTDLRGSVKCEILGAPVLAALSGNRPTHLGSPLAQWNLPARRGTIWSAA
jgi:hypothetical protein